MAYSDRISPEVTVLLQAHRVYCAKAPTASYDPVQGISLPELEGVREVTSALVTLRNLLREAELDPEQFDSALWNPLGAIVPEDARVVIKPNWVHHVNHSGQGMDCLVTHTTVIEAVLHYLIKASPRSIIIGDAPIQGCDFSALRATCRIDDMVRRFTDACPDLRVEDFRRTILPEGSFGAVPREDCRPLDDYVLFDLGTDSALEPIMADDVEFRITMYDPDVLKRHHTPGVHKYLIARSVIEADVVINVPKLKTHKKACVTGALKNLVGITGNKECLPHHRKGGSLRGGDCYEGRSSVKSLVENMLDATNRARQPAARRALAFVTKAGYCLGKALGADSNYEGSWHGNDTVWRMCLDLQRILHYGRADGTLASDVQRRVITITDAIVAGQREGPLSPTPVPLGLMTLGSNPAAIEWVHALLMGLDPERIPLIREAFAPHPLALAEFEPGAIRANVDGSEVSASDLYERCGRAFRPPRGWLGHCEAGGGPGLERDPAEEAS